jgi:hypothetical protein
MAKRTLRTDFESQDPKQTPKMDVTERCGFSQPSEDPGDATNF